MLNSGHKLTVTYYGEITIEPILNPEFDVECNGDAQIAQKILKKFPADVNIKSGSSTSTEPGGTGILINGVEITTVSYTHLTLPTILLV